MYQLTSRLWLGYGIAALLGVLLVGAVASGQTPPPDRDDVVLSGFLSCNAHKDSPRQCPFRLHYLDLNAGTTYAIRIESTEFNAHLAIEDLDGNLLVSDADCMTGDVTGCIWFTPPATDNYRFVVTASPPLNEGFYTVTVRELPIVMRLETALTTYDDVQDQCYQKVHDLTLNAGQRYIIELDSKRFTSCVKLLNPDGMIVAFDDEGSTTRPARITYEAPRTGVYRLVAASTTPYSVGAFTLTVTGDE